ncbi:MAG: efflux RND transporter periplasmic adaptor subunit [Pseudohongiellaceae bacterium]
MNHLLCSVILSLLIVGAATTGQAQQLNLDDVLAEERALVAGQGVRAQLIAVNHAMLSAGIAGQISEISANVGDSVEKGQTLIAFDCAPLLAQEKIYAAQKRAGDINIEVKQRLFELNNVGPQELALTQVELDSAEAQLEVIQLQVDQCEIKAPFAGSVITRNANPYETVTAGTELIELLAQDDLEVLLVAPSDWLSWLRVGESFTLSVEETKQAYGGSIVRLGGQVDPVSQTVLVWGKLTNSESELLPGMSGNIAFDGRR